MLPLFCFRSLQGKIGTRAFFHHLSAVHWPSPLCKLCHTNVEDTHHFFVSCSYKWSYQQAVSQELGLGNYTQSPESLWCVLISLHDLRRKPIDSDILLKIGCALNVLWLYHWYCVPNNNTWSTSAALAMLSSTPSLSIILTPFTE